MLDVNSKVYLGAAYYPEVWSLDNVDRDIEQMKQTGCNIMRIGEFAWGGMEPQEGVFTLDWISEVMDKLWAAGIHTILCTPSATPPQWLVNKYEEVLAMNDAGVRSQHGARRHTCPNSPTMRLYNHKINVKLAERFGSHPGLIGWQIDNEMYPFEGRGCFCPICKARFQTYLRDIYGTVENLNEKWGMARWSLTYDSFYSIIPPRRDTWNHPSLSMYWDYFMSDTYTAFSDEQADILHQYSNAPVGTDMMPFMDLSYVTVHKKLDMVQYNHYDDASNIHRQTFWMDYVRCIKDAPYWVTETQTGWNGSVAASPMRPDGYTYMNSWLSLALGGITNMYWLWKAHPHGHELLHGAVISSAGRLNYASNEIIKLSGDFEKCAEFIAGTKVRSKAAIHYSHKAHITFKSIPREYTNAYFNYCERLRDDFYLPITQEHHIGLDVIDYDHELNSYKVIFSPYLCTLDSDGLDSSIEQWVNDGGTWVVGPHSDIVDRHGKHYTDSPYGMLERLLGVYCKYQIPADIREFDITWSDGIVSKGKKTYDVFEASPENVLATYSDGGFENYACNVTARVGKGKIILLGTVPDNTAIGKLLDICNLTGYVASDNIFVVERQGTDMNGIIVIELRGRSDGYIYLDGEYTDLISGKRLSGKVEIPAYGVKVLQK